MCVPESHINKSLLCVIEPSSPSPSRWAMFAAPLPKLPHRQRSITLGERRGADCLPPSFPRRRGSVVDSTSKKVDAPATPCSPIRLPLRRPSVAAKHIPALTSPPKVPRRRASMTTESPKTEEDETFPPRFIFVPNLKVGRAA